MQPAAQILDKPKTRQICELWGNPEIKKFHILITQLNLLIVLNLVFLLVFSHKKNPAYCTCDEDLNNRTKSLVQEGGSKKKKTGFGVYTFTTPAQHH